jgi:pSer/pThr/pTyr-binding forkhead associated (FHA) protein
VAAARHQQADDPLATHSLAPRELKELLAARRRRRPFLALRGEDRQLVLFELGREEGNCTIGRRPEANVSIPWDGEVSGLHAELQCLGGEWTIVDDGLSTNGTFLNGERVLGRQRLHDGDLIRVGRTVLSYDLGEASSADATAIAGQGPSLPHLTDTQRRVLVALCGPLRDGGSFATTASNQQIADELHLSLDTVKTNLRTLFALLQLSELPQNRKRARLAELALEFGLVSRRELEQARPPGT